MADYFGDLQYVAETIPKRRWDYTLIAPASRPIHANVAARCRGSTSRSPSRATIASTASRRATSPRSTPSRRCRASAEIAPYLHVSTYATWDEVGAWYWHLVEESARPPTTSVRRTARGLVDARR